MDKVEKTIGDICDWIQRELNPDDSTTCEKQDVAEMVKALAELITARA